MKRLVLASSVLLALVCSHAHAACRPDDGASTPEEVVQAQVEAYNAHDVAALTACYADAASLIYLSGERPPIEGKDAIRTAFGFLATQPKTFHVEIVRRTVNGAVVVDWNGCTACRPASTCPMRSPSTRCARGASRKSGSRRRSSLAFPAGDHLFR